MSVQERRVARKAITDDDVQMNLKAILVYLQEMNECELADCFTLESGNSTLICHRLMCIRAHLERRYTCSND